MFVLTVIISLFLAASLSLSAFGKLSGDQRALAVIKLVGFPVDKVQWLGGLLLAGAVGLVVGLFSAPIGVLAAIGVIAYFTAAIAMHLRAGDRNIIPALVILVVAVVTLVLRAATA